MAYDTERKWFTDMSEAKNWLKNEYGNCKRNYIYQDTKDGETKRIGYIYGFRYKDRIYSSLEQHWVTFQKVTDITI